MTCRNDHNLSINCFFLLLLFFFKSLKKVADEIWRHRPYCFMTLFILNLWTNKTKCYDFFECWGILHFVLFNYCSVKNYQALRKLMYETKVNIYNWVSTVLPTHRVDILFMYVCVHINKQKYTPHSLSFHWHSPQETISDRIFTEWQRLGSVGPACHSRRKL